MRSRSVRRHPERRFKIRTREYNGGYARHDPRASGELAHCRTPCSCWMCGNPRRHLGSLTIQEQRVRHSGADESLLIRQ